MKEYSPEDVSVTVGGFVINGFSTYEPVSVRKSRLWYKDVEGWPYKIRAYDDSWCYADIQFTKEGYKEHIEPMTASEKSPFVFKEIEL